jgi:hypothetical protein
VKRHKPSKVREKKAYTPFPPPQQPSKEDLAIESGEYFLSEQVRTAACDSSVDLVSRWKNVRVCVSSQVQQHQPERHAVASNFSRSWRLESCTAVHSALAAGYIGCSACAEHK